jgi:hypothetical protein
MAAKNAGFCDRGPNVMGPVESVGVADAGRAVGRSIGVGLRKLFNALNPLRIRRNNEKFVQMLPGSVPAPGAGAGGARRSV